MIADVKILPSLMEFDHSKIDDVALLHLLKQLVLVRLVFDPGGKLQSPLSICNSKCALDQLGNLPIEDAM